MAILVTGGAGFIGSHVCEKLVEQGKKVVCVDNFNEFNGYKKQQKYKNIKSVAQNVNYKLVEAELGDEEAMRNVFETNEIESVIHLAAFGGVRASVVNKIRYYENNFIVTTLLLKLLEEFGIRKIVFSSSSTVYSKQNPPFVETMILGEQLNPYSSSKAQCEKALKAFANRFGSVSCLRLFSVYGPRVRPDLALSIFAKKIDRNEIIENFGGNRDYTYIDDAVVAIVSALELLTQKNSFEIFNIAGGELRSVEELIFEVEKCFGKKAIVINKEKNSFEMTATQASTEKAKQQLGFFPKVEFSKGIKSFVDWWKNENQ